MPFVKVADLAYGRLQSPSLDEAEEFLVHFGMVRSERTPNALYMRGTDPAHHLHVTHLGPSKFIGLAFFVDNEDDLKKLAKAPGASGIEQLDEPGGGKRVRIDDPPGYQMEVICGMKKLKRLPTRKNVLNWAAKKRRPTAGRISLPAAPPQYTRLAN